MVDFRRLFLTTQATQAASGLMGAFHQLGMGRARRRLMEQDAEFTILQGRRQKLEVSEQLSSQLASRRAAMSARGVDMTSESFRRAAERDIDRARRAERFIDLDTQTAADHRRHMGKMAAAQARVSFADSLSQTAIQGIGTLFQADRLGLLEGFFDSGDDREDTAQEPLAFRPGVFS